MNAVVSLVIQLLAKLVPAVADNQALIGDVVASLEQMVPVLVKEYQDILPEVQNIIAALKGTDGITAEQWNALDALETQIDTEFEAAAKDEDV